MISPLFTIRPNFVFDKAINWFPGHMAKGLRVISERLSSVDVVVEIPLSSINNKFEDIAKLKDRIIVYNKADLADESAQMSITDAFREYRKQRVIFTDANTDKNVKMIIDFAANKAIKEPEKYPYVTVMVVGMPNVGKSSLINSMRRLGIHKGKAVKTGALPGVTRSVSATSIKVSEDPTVYLIDTPGVMIPHITDPVASLKVALTGGIRDHLSDEEIMADYLLWRLNNFGNFSYVEKFKLSHPTDSIEFLLPEISKRIGALQKYGEYDLNKSAIFFIKQFRNGKYGRYTLDDVSPEGLKTYFTGGGGSDKDIIMSKNQRKKLEWGKVMEKRLNRWKKHGYLTGKGKRS
ncbi:P-loop containing nucleoside triphosphate hydrolase protein [Gigaspora margarita]|uniref:P-loop containing nucleoside triphosphate hydrolase protein n=1 Tax=Gigaspora margarita TaxID=4874 RepID=A0A8H4AF41_GIGMA|nr:P-loop containing nucleoside triphosphate hydrolase protein [Gigaspora margarita]